MLYDAMILGFTIFRSYEVKEVVYADAHEIRAGAVPPDLMVSEDREKLESAGWRWRNDLGVWRHLI